MYTRVVGCGLQCSIFLILSLESESERPGMHPVIH